MYGNRCYLRAMTVPNVIGPILHARGCDRSLYHLSAVLVSPPGDHPRLSAMGGPRVEPIELGTICGRVAWRYDFALPTSDRAFYQLDDVRYRVNADLAGDARIVYASCGADAGERDAADGRYHMWRRLQDEHERQPFSLMLHGGGQLDPEGVLDVHPELSAWSWSGRAKKPAETEDFTEEVRNAVEAHLFRCYAKSFTRPEVAHLLARVPSLMMWSDKDFTEEWGRRADGMAESLIGRGLLQVFRQMFLLFQRGATEAHPADRDRQVGRSLGFTASFPGFEIIAPDLCSERRPDHVMGQDGWLVVTQALTRLDAKKQLFLMSSLPLLGPGLERIEGRLRFMPRLRRHRHDAKQQWQSRAHVGELERFFKLLDRTVGERNGRLAVLSGAIGLAARGDMPLNGAFKLAQLTTSGLTRPPSPRPWATLLRYLNTFGRNALPGRKARMRKLPGLRRTYTAERAYLVLERGQDGWTAIWELEESGRTQAVTI